MDPEKNKATGVNGTGENEGVREQRCQESIRAGPRVTPEQTKPPQGGFLFGANRMFADVFGTMPRARLNGATYD